MNSKAYASKLFPIVILLFLLLYYIFNINEYVRPSFAGNIVANSNGKCTPKPHSKLLTINSSGGVHHFKVSINSECVKTISTTAPWITLRDKILNDGQVEIAATINPNTSNFERYTLLSIAGRIIGIKQKGKEITASGLRDNKLDVSSKIISSPTISTAGNDFYTGSGGIQNKVIYSGLISQYTISVDDSSIIQVADNVPSRDGVDSLINIQRVQFLNQTVAFDADSASSAGGIYRLYAAAFNREPDLAGLGYWIGQADLGMSASQIATGFTYSEEFKKLYKINQVDASNISNVITGIYLNVLHRQPDLGGLQFYANLFLSGSHSIGQILAVISDSPENRTQVASKIKNGIPYQVFSQNITLFGAISGLTENGLKLTTGAQTITVSPYAGSFNFFQTIPTATKFNITIASQPSNQYCIVLNGSGVFDGYIDNISISCSRLNSQQMYSIGGGVSGLSTPGFAVTSNGQTVAISPGSSSFTFPYPLASGATYSVSIANPSQGQTCAVSNGNGKIVDYSVNNMLIQCTDSSFYNLGGLIDGLTSAGLVLGNGGQQITVQPGSTAFTFPTPIASGTNYALQIISQPQDQFCQIAGGVGRVTATSSKAVQITCSSTNKPNYILSGSITGLAGSGLVIGVNGQNIYPNATDLAFSFPIPLAPGSVYNVVIYAQPINQSCSIKNASGFMNGYLIKPVEISCSKNIPFYTISGKIGNFNSSGLILLTNGQTVSPLSGATNFSFLSTIQSGERYSVSILSQPLGQLCKVNNGTGIISGPVINVSIDCITQYFTSTVAGDGSAGFLNGQLSSATFNFPSGIVVDVNGDAYVADTNNNVIRKISFAQSGSSGTSQQPTVSTYAGTGIAGFNNGSLSVASFNRPTGLAVDTSGNLYVADTGNNAIRKISGFGGGGTSGNTTSAAVSTIAGTGGTGSLNGSNQQATFNQPRAIVVGSSGSVYVADTGNNLIRKIVIDYANAVTVSTVAGMGVAGSQNGSETVSSFRFPGGIAVDASEKNIYVADTGNNLIRKITFISTYPFSSTISVSTLAGTGLPGMTDGDGSASSFNGPVSIIIQTTGDLLVVDQWNHGIRKITNTGIVSTLAGTGIQGNANGSAQASSFNSPTGISTDRYGRIYISDTYNHLIRRISPY